MWPRYLIFYLTFIFPSCASTLKKRNYLDRGNQYAQDGLLREAAHSYSKALAKNKTNYEAQRNLGIVLLKLGDYKNALKKLKKSSSYFQKDFESYHYLGEAYRGVNKYAQAIHAYQSALQIRPRAHRTQKALAWCYYKIRFYGEALKVSRRLIKQTNKDAQVIIIAAKILIKLKRYNDTLMLIKKHLRFTHNSKYHLPYLQAVKADAQYYLGRTQQAKKNYRLALKKQPLMTTALIGMARIYKRENPLKSIDYLTRAIHIQPRSPEAYFLLGKIYERRSPRKSAKAYKRFTKLASDDPEYLHLINSIKRKISMLSSKN